MPATKSLRLRWNAVCCTAGFGEIEHYARRLWQFSSVFLHVGLQQEILQTLASPALAALKKQQPHLAFKYLSRRYLLQGLSTAQRGRLLQHHYACLTRHFPTTCLQRLATQRLPLWQSRIETRQYLIELGFSQDLDEGELTLFFSCQGRDTSHLAFSFAAAEQLGESAQESLLISRVQGGLGCYEEIRQATRDLRQVAPSHLLFAALRGIAQALAIRLAIGVPGHRQVCHRGLARQQNFTQAYDAFWESLGADQAASGLFLLPLDRPEKPLQLIKQHHRARTQAKRELKASLANEVASLLNSQLG